jgi:hypothetical protein
VRRTSTVNYREGESLQIKAQAQEPLMLLCAPAFCDHVHQGVMIRDNFKSETIVQVYLKM